MNFFFNFKFEPVKRLWRTAIRNGLDMLTQDRLDVSLTKKSFAKSINKEANHCWFLQLISIFAGCKKFYRKKFTLNEYKLWSLNLKPKASESKLYQLKRRKELNTLLTCNSCSALASLLKFETIEISWELNKNCGLNWPWVHRLNCNLITLNRKILDCSEWFSNLEIESQSQPEFRI